MNVDTQNNVHLGLTSNQANENLVAFGYNEIGSSQLNTRLQQIIKIFSDPMGLMLLGLAILYFMIGENKDAVILLVAFIPVTAIDVFLELKSEKALETLRGHLQLTSKIYRDGVIVDLPTRLIVPDDVLVFEEGQTIPADGQIIDCQDLSVSEAALTGESIPVTKSKGDQFLTGTTILSGRGLGRITRTAKNTEFGRMAMPTMSAYSASKFALEGATESLWYEMKPWGIHVSLVIPGFINSEGFRHTTESDKCRISIQDEYANYHEHYMGMKNLINRRMLHSGDTNEKIANKILQLITNKNPPLRVYVTLDSFIFYIFRKFCPERLYLFIIYRFLPNISRWGKQPYKV